MFAEKYVVWSGVVGWPPHEAILSNLEQLSARLCHMFWPSVDVDVYVQAAIGVVVNLDCVTSAVHLLALIYRVVFQLFLQIKKKNWLSQRRKNVNVDVDLKQLSPNCVTTSLHVLELKKNRQGMEMVMMRWRTWTWTWRRWSWGEDLGHGKWTWWGWSEDICDWFSPLGIKNGWNMATCGSHGFWQKISV